MDLQSQWLDVLRTCNEPVEARDRSQIEQEEIARHTTWEEAREQIKRYERNNQPNIRKNLG